jgi:A/G-specific adenine glycosylase
MQEFLRALKRYYRTQARAHLPWRATTDAYKVLVSEIMLQQTQVDRVIPKYRAFLKEFPTVRALAEASLSEVLWAWQGLGYNRRGKFLHDAAKMIVGEYDGKVPQDPLYIEKLPGVGHYTARAVAAFAYNRPEVFLETIIRTIFFHHFFTRSKKKVNDKELLVWVEEALRKSRMQPRDFYAACMDYGSYLKKNGVRVYHLSLHYAKQSKFEGSKRQKRAQYLRALLSGGASEKELREALA